MCFAGYALYDVYQVYEDTELSGEVLKYKPKVDEYGELKEKFSIKDLQKINKDIVGWIKIDNTNIDYPILAGIDNTDYLKRNYKGEYSPSGSIFLDYRNSRDLTDDFSIIYGHNMAKGLMFSDIKKFKEPTFFVLNKTGKLYTKDKVYNLEIYSFNIIKSNKDITYKLNKNSDSKEIVNNLLNEAINKRELVIGDNDKYLLLSTCYGVNTYDRSVILTKMIETYGNIIDSNIENNNTNIERYIDEDFKIIKNNQRTNLISKMIVLLIYILIGFMIYLHIIVDHIRKKRRINNI